jgi:lipopolysaccharide export system permease protein
MAAAWLRNAGNGLNLLDRYIFRSVLFTCLGAVGLFAFVLMVGNIMKELMGFVLAGQIDLMTLLRLTGLLFPFVVTFALPMGMLTGVLLTLGRLSADSEVTAMRSVGVGLWRMARPLFILALMGCATALYINHELMPWARVTYKRELAEAIRANPLSFVVPRTYIRQFPGVVVYVGEKKGAELRDFWLWQLDKEQRVVRQVHALSGSITYDEAGNTLVLTLRQAKVEVRKESRPEDFSEPALIGSFQETEAVRLPLDRMFNRSAVRTKLDFLPRAELSQEEERLSVVPAKESPEEKHERERKLTRVQLVVSERYNNALAVLSFTLMGLPLGIRVSRRETSANLGMAVALALGYYIVVTAISWLEKQPQLRPDLLLYLPNLFCIVMGLILLNRAEKR